MARPWTPRIGCKGSPIKPNSMRKAHLHIPLHLRLSSALFCFALYSLSSSRSLPSLITLPLWLQTCHCPFRRGRLLHLLTTTRRPLLALGSMMNCPLETWDSIRLRSPPCLRPFLLDSMRRLRRATPSPRRPRPVFTRPQAEHSHTHQRVLLQLIPRPLH